MIKITVDSAKQGKPIKRMHAVGQPPISGGFLKFDFSHMKHLQNAGIPYSRLHDVYGAFGSNRFVDIPNIFRDFDADADDPASYDFAFTDALIEAMYSYGLKPVFRLGVTIENQAHIKPIHIFPPKDYAKWARVCEHIIRHYNEGWADGFHYGIEYWEIWNEPDGNPRLEMNQMWRGTPAQFYELYHVTATHLKSCFGDSIKVGGYGACELCGIFYDPEKFGIDFPKAEPDALQEKYEYRIGFFTDFLKYIKAHGSPLDFFSWHSYRGVSKTVVMDEFVHRTLCEYGYGDVEVHINEWNNAPAFEPELHGSSHAAASAASMMIALQHGHADMLMYYDTRVEATAYGGFFAPFTHEPVATYYSFVAFGRLYALGTETEVRVEGAERDFYALSATDGQRNALMLVNRTGKKQQLCLEGVDLSAASLHVIDKTHLLSMAFNAEEIKNNGVLLIEW